MKITPIILALTLSVSLFAACHSNQEAADNKDSIDAVRSADSMLQEQLNADTSASSLGDSVDTIGEEK